MVNPFKTTSSFHSIAGRQIRHGTKGERENCREFVGEDALLLSKSSHSNGGKADNGLGGSGPAFEHFRAKKTVEECIPPGQPTPHCLFIHWEDTMRTKWHTKRGMPRARGAKPFCHFLGSPEVNGNERNFCFGFSDYILHFCYFLFFSKFFIFKKLK